MLLRPGRPHVQWNHVSQHGRHKGCCSCTRARAESRAMPNAAADGNRLARPRPNLVAAQRGGPSASPSLSGAAPSHPASQRRCPVSLSLSRSVPVVGHPQQQRQGQQNTTTRQSAIAWQHLMGRQQTSAQQPMVVFQHEHGRTGRFERSCRMHNWNNHATCKQAGWPDPAPAAAAVGRRQGGPAGRRPPQQT
jgi:hypothetical protein